MQQSVLYRSTKPKSNGSLRSIIPNKTRLIRSGTTFEIPSANLVPGDLILLEAGNRIPADVRFIETYQVKVDESTLTGESHSVEK
jgi:Ca2+-transporting ATPase